MPGVSAEAQQALDRRHALPAGTAWGNYVRSHDDIGWTFADEDAAAQGAGVVAHDELLVDPRDRVGDDDLERSWLLGEGIAEARDVDTEELIAFVKERIGSVKAPKEIEIWTELPRSKVGKILKTEVRGAFS